MKLKYLSIVSGEMVPDFDSDTEKYSLTVPVDTDAVTIDSAVINGNLEYKLNGPDGTTFNLVKPDNSKFSKLEIGLFIDAIANGRYIVSIAEEIPEPVILPPEPITPDIPEDNYSYEDPNNCFIEKWGYYEMKTNSKLSDKSEAYLEMYRRVYNILKNGDSVASYQYQKFGTTDIETQDTIKTLPAASTGLPNSVNVMVVPFYDLGISNEAAQYVWKCVCIDCPEIMWRFASVNDRSEGASDISGTADFGNGMCLLIPYYPDAQRLNYISKCEETFELICQKVEETYGITYVEDNFINNNARYTAEEKRKIGKVIHDFIEVNNVYGFTSEGDGMNQTMYPALSMGIRHPVCASYSQAVKYCCWKWGIHAVCINGGCNNSRDARHQWNLVCYEVGNLSMFDGVASAWQEVDCTWDDPYGSEGNNLNPEGCSWSYFNISTDEIERDQPTADLIDAINNAGYNVSANKSVRTRFFTKYPFQPDQGNVINIEHYITYPARGSCRNNIYKINGHRVFDNSGMIPIPEFNGETYSGF